MRSTIHAPALSTAIAIAALLGACDPGQDTPTVSVTGGGTAEVSPVSTPLTPAPAPVVTERVAPAPATYAESEAAFHDRRYDDARRGFEAHVEREPGNVWGWYMLGLSNWKAGNLEPALVAFDSALARDPGHLKSLHNATRVLLDADRPREAVERAQAAVATDPADQEGYRLLGRSLHGIGDTEGAVAAYRQALVLNGRDLWALNNLGVVYLDAGMLDEAIGPLGLAVEIDARSPVFQNNLGSVLERVGDLAGARDAYRGALEADSTYAKAATSLARVEGLIREGAERTVDLPARVEAFEMSIRMWRDTARAGAQEVPGHDPDGN